MGRKAASQATTGVPGASSSHLGTRDSVEPASESSCLKGEREWVLSYEMLLVEDRGGEGGQDKGPISLTWALKARRSLQGKKCRSWLADLGLKGMEEQGQGVMVGGLMLAAVIPIAWQGAWHLALSEHVKE